MGGFNAEAFVIGMIVIICSITLHEFGHAVSADYLGDPGPRQAGRVNLWPDRHFDPLGFLMIVVTQAFGFGIGWGKPVMVQPGRFRNPQRDMVIVALCGPVMNLLLALTAGIIMRVSFQTGHDAWLLNYHSNLADAQGIPLSVAGKFLSATMRINFALMFFNMIPVPPLDGSKILAGLLHADLAYKYEQIMQQFGLFLLIALVGSGAVGKILVPAVTSAIQMLVPSLF